MKANEFVKKFGWVAVKHDFSGYFKDEEIGTIQILTHAGGHIEVNGDDLKRLVESHELVEYCHGIDEAKELLEEIQSEKWCYNLLTNTCVASEYAPSDELSIHYKDLKQAIADVGSCYD